MKKVIHFLSGLGFWPFIFVFTCLAIVISELLIMIQSYWLTGGFFETNLLIVGFITPAIDAFLVFLLTAFIIRYHLAIQTELESTKNKLVEQNNRLLEVQDTAHLGFWELDLKNDELYWSDEVYKIFGLKPQAFSATYEAFLEYVHPEDRDALNREYMQSIEEKRKYKIVHRIIQSDGTMRYVEERCRHTFDKEGNVVRSIGTVYDITDRIADQQKLQKLFDLQENILIQTDGRQLQKVNHSFLEFFGLESLEEFLKYYNCICERFVENDRFFHLGKIEKDENWVKVMLNMDRKERVVSMLDKDTMPFAFSVAVNHFSDNVYIVSFSDISETMVEHFSLQQKVNHDHLTGAYSRDYFDRNVQLLIESAKSKELQLGFVMFDIDNFKNVNDTYGHPVGDEVLRRLVEIVKYSIRQDDIVIRWGGEEFILLVETSSIEQLQQLAENIRERIESEAIDTVGKVTCSFGVALHRIEEMPYQTIERTDSALYSAKKSGKNRIVLAEASEQNHK